MDYDIMLKRSLAAEHEAIKEFGWSLETYENTDLKRLNAVITAERQESADNVMNGMTKYQSPVFIFEERRRMYGC